MSSSLKWDDASHRFWGEFNKTVLTKYLYHVALSRMSFCVQQEEGPELRASTLSVSRPLPTPHPPRRWQEERPDQVLGILASGSALYSCALPLSVSWASSVPQIRGSFVWGLFFLRRFLCGATG